MTAKTTTTATTTTNPYPPDINLGPLTTTFNSPPDCTRINILPVFYGAQTSSIGYLSAVIHTAPSCYPSSKPLGAVYTQSTLALFYNHDEHIFYSPGLCPSDWISRPVSTVLVSPTLSGVVAAITETAAFCCPPGFRAWTQVHETENTSDFFWRCDSDIRVPTTVSSGSWMALFGTTSLRADAVFIKYREGDFAQGMVTSSGTVVRTGASTSTSSTVQASSPIPAAVSAGGLSAGAKIGLGIGVPVILIFVGIMSAWLLMRRRKRKQQSFSAGEVHGAGDGPHYLPGYKAELEASSAEKTIRVRETQREYVTELNARPGR